MFKKLKKEVCNYFGTSDITFDEISSGRSNTNYFIKVGNKKYFLRTNITKVNDLIFGGKLEKENKIYQMLKGKKITAEIVYFFDNKDDLQFIVTEKVDGQMPKKFNENQQCIIELLQKFQNIKYGDFGDFEFLETFNFKNGFKNIIEERFKRIKKLQSKEIISELINYLYNNKWEIKEDFVLCHNDFRSDNIIYSNNNSRIIDLEGLIISDKYIDVVEYFVGGVFWDNFEDQKEFDYEIFQNYMNKYGYIDKQKQKYIFIMKFCSNYSWLSSHISETEKPLEIYLQAFERNTKKYYTSISKLLS